jgi:hypothetical protein
MIHPLRQVFLIGLRTILLHSLSRMRRTHSWCLTHFMHRRSLSRNDRSGCELQQNRES